MKVITQYQCSICNRIYDYECLAEQCETSHIEDCKYYEISEVDFQGEVGEFPYYITIKDIQSNKTQKYIKERD